MAELCSRFPHSLGIKRYMRGMTRMLGLIIFLAVACPLSGLLGLGALVPMAGPMQSLFLTLTAFLGVALVAACDAFEARPIRVKRDDEH